MCGRFSQYRTAVEYLDALRYDKPIEGGIDPEPINRYNVAPRSRVMIFFESDSGLRMAKLPWGYQPFWAAGKRPPAINARVETAATSKFFREVWSSGRTLVTADGWFEWVKDPDDAKIKQPYYIRRRDGEPLWFAALAKLDRTGMNERDGDGFVIITADSDQGMVDIHDRRPVVLEADLAREWVDQETAPERAEEIVRDWALPVEAFVWFPVDRAVGDVRNEGSHLIQKISGPVK